MNKLNIFFFRKKLLWIFLSVFSVGWQESHSEDGTDGIYREKKLPLLWYREDGGLKPEGQTAIALLRNAADEGLNPLDYQKGIDAAFDNKKQLSIQMRDRDITQSLLLYIRHVRSGRIEPKKIAQEIKLPSHKVNAEDILLEALISKDPCDALRQGLSVPWPQYVFLKQQLILYRAIEARNPDYDEYIRLPAISQSIKPGESYAALPKIRRLLIMLGDLTPQDHMNLNDPHYTPEVVEAIQRFQKRHLLDVDGHIGQKTLEILKTPIRKMIHKIIVNMERMRWLSASFEEKHIQVNVGGYEVWGYEGGKWTLTIPAIIGRPSRRTPLLEAPLQSIILNPSWGVPPGIMASDKIPKLLQDPDYAARSGFIVTGPGGDTVDAADVDWAFEGMRYNLRQMPGANNALGRIKFSIQNPYNIYLHGTPDVKLFQKPVRMFSSGCVRLEDPLRLAEWVLKKEHPMGQNFTQDTLQDMIEQGKTRTLSVITPVKVYFVYLTLWGDQNGTLYASNDPYHFDQRIESALGLE